MFGNIKKAVMAPALAIGSIATGGMLLDQYWNYKNYQLQKEQYNYEKELQQTIFSREDNATQRRVADLRAAGLSPVLAAGSPAGAGAVVSTQAPQIGKFGLDEKVAGLISMIKMDADISRTREEERYIQQQRYNLEKMLPFQIDATKANAQSARSSAYSNTQEGNLRRWEMNQRNETGMKGGSVPDVLRDTISNYIRGLQNRFNNRKTDRSGTSVPGWRVTPDGYTERIRR